MMAEKLYSVTNTITRTFIDDTGQPVLGYRIFFVTKSGLTGFVDVAKAGYSDELASKKLHAEAERLEATLKL